MLSFSKTTVFTMNYTPCGWEPFWDLFGTGRGQGRARAEPEPSRAGPGRAAGLPGLPAGLPATSAQVSQVSPLPGPKVCKATK